MSKAPGIIALLALGAIIYFGREKGDEYLPEVKITEIEGNVTAYIPGMRVRGELSRIDQATATDLGLEPDNWLWFNRLISQSEIPRAGTKTLEKILEYCKEKNYSIVNQVNAYGDISQEDLENWYIRKGFTPVDYEKYGNTLLKWVP